MNTATTARSTRPDVQLPPAFYRGDSDPQRTRKVVSLAGSGFLLTNMANGGDPLEILKRPFDELLRRHVDTGWRLSHFLSFSTDYEVARRYAVGAEGRELRSADAHWDTALFTFDLTQVRITQVHQPGIYDAEFPGRSTCIDRRSSLLEVVRHAVNQNQQGQIVRIRLVDTVTYLSDQVARAPELATALEKARRDAEWLVLPLDPPVGDDPIGATAALDSALITCERFASS